MQICQAVLIEETSSSQGKTTNNAINADTKTETKTKSAADVENTGCSP